MNPLTIIRQIYGSQQPEYRFIMNYLRNTDEATETATDGDGGGVTKLAAAAEATEVAATVPAEVTLTTHSSLSESFTVMTSFSPTLTS